LQRVGENLVSTAVLLQERARRCIQLAESLAPSTLDEMAACSRYGRELEALLRLHGEMLDEFRAEARLHHAREAG
jgi:hypothetical protein